MTKAKLRAGKQPRILSARFVFAAANCKIIRANIRAAKIKKGHSERERRLQNDDKSNFDLSTLNFLLLAAFLAAEVEANTDGAGCNTYNHDS